MRTRQYFFSWSKILAVRLLSTSILTLSNRSREYTEAIDFLISRPLILSPWFIFAAVLTIRDDVSLFPNTLTSSIVSDKDFFGEYLLLDISSGAKELLITSIFSIAAVNPAAIKVSIFSKSVLERFPRFGLMTTSAISSSSFLRFATPIDIIWSTSLTGLFSSSSLHIGEVTSTATIKSQPSSLAVKTGIFDVKPPSVRRRLSI